MGTGGIREGIPSRSKALIAWLWKRSVEEFSAENQEKGSEHTLDFCLSLARIELLTAGMIKKPRQCFESNRMDRYLASSSPTSSDGINELWEEDLWPVDLKEADLEAVEDRKINNCMEGQFVIRSTGFHGSLWMILRMGDSSSDAGLRQHHQSAPVNVPDWSKILGVDYLKEQNPFAMDVEMAGDEEEEEKGDRLPPHEYLAREDARCRVFTKASILQGVGLKGREMSRVRNAVWRQTGFLG